jgi:outer membrane lipoprotein SlyB
MNNVVVTVAVGVLVTAVGCASQSGYRPTVDTHNNPNAQNLTRDEAECRELARQSSGGTGTQTAKGAVGGGLLGAAAGAAIGAATGDPGKGAAVGAAAGGIGGGAYKGLSADEQFKRAFNNCMRNRGHTVID